MRTASNERLLLAAAAIASVITACPAAFAGNCSDLPNPIYGLGGSSIKPFVGKVATVLANVLPTPTATLVYQYPGNCFGINALIGNTKIVGTASYWDVTGKEQTCDLDIAGNTVQVAVMNTYATSCAGVAALPATIGDFLGPIQAFDFIVPQMSGSNSISAAAAYFVYGFGAAGEASPWVNETYIIKRDENSAAALLISQAINVPVGKLKGVDGLTNAGTVTDVAAAPKDLGIGFVADEVAVASPTVKVLAYQHYNQDCGYWPSSTATSFDKMNIRDGQYFIWGNIHFMAPIDANTKLPSDPGAAAWIGYFTGTKPLPSSDILTVETKVGTIPDCAMEVKRTSDLGAVASYAPEAPCGCFFEYTVTGKTSCTTCTGNPDCGVNAPNCRYGYCEVN